MLDREAHVFADVEVVAAVLEAAEAAAPLEACGLLLGRNNPGGICLRRCVPSPNLAPDPIRRFEVDPAVRLRLQSESREGGDPVLGVYHSHPAGRPEPSETDRRFLLEPGLVWLIAAPDPHWRIGAWLALKDDFRELELIVGRT